MTPAQHGAAPSILGVGSSSHGGDWGTLVQGALSLAILLALSILWWRTLRPRPSPGRNDEKPSAL